MKPTTFIHRLVATPATVAASDKYDRNVEGKIQSTIVQWLELHGVFVIRSKMNKRTSLTPGTPDLCFVMKGFPFALEIKRPGKTLSVQQADVLRKMCKNGWIAGWFEDAQKAIDFIKEQTP